MRCNPYARGGMVVNEATNINVLYGFAIFLFGFDNMHTLRIGTERGGVWSRPIIEYLMNIIGVSCEWSNENCDVVVTSFWNRGPGGVLWNKRNLPYIAYSGEAHACNMVSPYASRIMHLNCIYKQSSNSVWTPMVMNSPYFREQPRAFHTDLNDRHTILAYCASHKIAEREVFYDMAVRILGAHKCVALGKLCGQFPQTRKRCSGWWGSDDVPRAMSACRFAMAFENKISCGYVTEKVMHAFAAGAIPIYWGSDKIYEIINRKAIIDVASFSGIQACIEFVRDMSDDDWHAMRNVPVYKDGFDALKSVFEPGARSMMHFIYSRCCRDSCMYLRTWHTTHCCNNCMLGRKHGPGCALQTNAAIVVTGRIRHTDAQRLRDVLVGVPNVDVYVATHADCYDSALLFAIPSNIIVVDVKCKMPPLDNMIQWLLLHELLQHADLSKYSYVLKVRADSAFHRKANIGWFQHVKYGIFYTASDWSFYADSTTFISVMVGFYPAVISDYYGKGHEYHEINWSNIALSELPDEELERYGLDHNGLTLERLTGSRSTSGCFAQKLCRTGLLGLRELVFPRSMYAANTRLLQSNARERASHDGPYVNKDRHGKAKYRAFASEKYFALHVLKHVPVHMYNIPVLNRYV